MKGTSHHSISQIKGLLDTVSMMDIYIDIQNSLKGFK
jgi:hypothetical protein